ncbi:MULTISPECIES: glycosyltransferase family 2 protein [Winogradskyella]|uniref:Glycosyltransferase, GT2 family n=1 Tax=Winogradskyella thalassocola TaxID=262004 RepID=A0A1G8FXU0_9FLAO|nr:MULTISPECIES: glycosyltransferase [Winogradskyella]SDH86943.1 Glycosyltransferase, GT2 family [Winogradskyella thalassocola]
MNPKVSICIPTYNGVKFIAEAMDSAICQTYGNLEIIVSDDASIDGTLKIIETYKFKTSIPISVYHHEPNGIGANWNNCIKKAKGDYIKFLFQDDVLIPSCIEQMVNILEQNPKLGMVASKRKFIVEQDLTSDATKLWIEKYGDLQRGLHFKINKNVQIIDRSLFKSNEFLKPPIKNKIGEPSAVLFRKSITDIIGFYREDLKQILDYEFCYRLLKKQDIAIINENLVKFRLHHNQATNVNSHSNISDYKTYNRILLREYFWCLNANARKRLLKKEYKLINFLFKIKSKLHGK